MISVREVFLKIMNFEPVRRTLKWELGYWVGTVVRWYEEGLIINKGYDNSLKYGDSLIGPGCPFTSRRPTGLNPQKAYDVIDYFNLDSGWNTVPYNFWMFPMFEIKVIYEDDNFIEYYGSDGVRRKEFKDKKSMPMFLDFPVKNRKDWEKVKEERFNMDSINNRFMENEEEFIKNAKNRSEPLGILGYPVGFFGSIRWLIGEKNLFMLYYDDPGLIMDILNYLCDLWIFMCEELTSKIEFDFAVFWEDMAGKCGSLISPKTFREFMMPYYKRIVRFLKQRGINIFALDTDGNVEELIPLFLDAGVNTLFPFERQANNDLFRYREKFPRLRMLGGINKNEIAKGEIYIDKELKEIPTLISKGGYIPFLDHNVPPNISWNNYKYYRNKLDKIIESTKVLS